MIDGDTKFFINPTGKFVVGGPMGGLRRLRAEKLLWIPMAVREVMAEAAFQEKNPSKVDRSASYMGRYIAKNNCGLRYCQ